MNWDPEKFPLFISHTSSRKEEVHALRDALAAYDIEAFVAHDDIEPTQAWQDEIEIALATCEALVAWLSADFVESKWCDQEVGYVIGRPKVVIPVRIDANPHGFIGKYQALPGAGRPYADTARDIADILLTNELSARRMAELAVAQFVNAYSFDSARTRFDRLKRIPRSAWTQELLDQVKAAPGANDQIEHAFHERERMPDLIDALVDDLRLTAEQLTPVEQKPDEAAVESARLDARVISQGGGRYAFEIENDGPVPVEQVEFELPDGVTNWTIITDGFASYPIRLLEPGDSVRTVASVSMGGPVAIEILLKGLVDGQPYTRTRPISIF